MQEENVTEQKLNIDKKRTSLLVLGMAGSGKTTFIQKLTQKIQEKYGDAGYILNTDPAVKFVPYTPQQDIREKIDIKKLMKSHGLGPNGAIVTAMNLYCTEIDQTVDEILENKHLSDFVLVDTPGQIEVFSWSASGSIISQALSTSMPTVLVYVIDIQRCMNPNSFMNNMIFALSIFYKMKLPMVLVFNKEDTGNKEKLFTWMKDYEAFLDALQNEKSFLSSLSKSMVLNLDEFYSELKCCAVSSTLGTGFDTFFPLIDEAKKEYFDVTLPDIEAKINSRSEQEQKRIKEQMSKFKQDQKLLEEEMVKQTKQAGFNPMVNVFNVGGQNQQGNENKTIKDLKQKKQQMDLETEQKKQQQQIQQQNSSSKNNNNSEVQIEEEVQNLDLNKQN